MKRAPVPMMKSALGERRVQGWLAVLVLMFSGLMLWPSRNSAAAPPAVATAAKPTASPAQDGNGPPPPVPVPAEPASAKADVQPADSIEGLIKQIDGEPQDTAAENGTKAPAAQPKPLTPTLRATRDEWVCAYEIVTGQKWTGSFASLIQLCMGMPAPDPDLTLVAPITHPNSIIADEARAIRSLGTTHVIGLNFSGRKLDDQRLVRFKDLPNLKVVYLAGAKLDAVTEKGISALAECQQLRFIDLHGQGISDEYLTGIGKCPALMGLDLRGTRITNQGIKHLKNKTLQQLDISGTKVTEAGLADLERFTKLEYLSFKDCPVKDWSYLPHFKSLNLTEYGMILPVKWASIATRYVGSPSNGTIHDQWSLTWRRSYDRHRPTSPPAPYSNDNFTPPIEGREIVEVIQNMKALKEVDLCFAVCTDEDLKLLSKLENLEILDLSWSKITTDGLKHLAALKHLKYLNLSSTPLKYWDLRFLKDFPALVDVGVDNTHLSKDQIQKLEEEMPRVKFWSEKLQAP